ncbi:MAG TPA: UDP-N-acetylmuramate dehydrogenase [Stellaceae bacterium]|nr:UDP-N-acetylmuramate dehydrogenase [Stellaceae bacterium]
MTGLDVAGSGVTGLPIWVPPARGRISAQAPIGRQTWFGVGGPAEILFRPTDEADLAEFLGALPEEIPVTVIGVGSNLLVRDGGIPGVTIRLGRGFAEIAAAGERVTAGAGALDLNVALQAAEAGIAGLEFLSGVPGTIGGGLRMNAGAYGSEIKDVLVAAAALDRQGRRHCVPGAAMDLSYRHCGVASEWIFVEALLHGRRDAPAAIARRMDEIRTARETTQPIRAHTGGSTFKNPPGESAWRLIDRAGCRGLEQGGARISEKHANFLINTGAATAADLEALGEEVRRRVYESSGILLEWEIRRVGRPSPGREPVQGALC